MTLNCCHSFVRHETKKSAIPRQKASARQKFTRESSSWLQCSCTDLAAHEQTFVLPRTWLNSHSSAFTELHTHRDDPLWDLGDFKDPLVLGVFFEEGLKGLLDSERAGRPDGRVGERSKARESASALWTALERNLSGWAGKMADKAAAVLSSSFLYVLSAVMPEKQLLAQTHS